MKGRYRYRYKKSRDDKIRRTSQSTVLKSGYTVNQTWKALSKAWHGDTIAKNKEEGDRMKYYSSVIQKLRKEIGLPPASFPHLVTDEDISKEKSNRKKNSENDNNHKEKSRVY
jgi:hypothetical protein